jgi:fluoroquinolone transport system permease protein
LNARALGPKRSLKRLLSTIRWDVQLQFRQGFYYVSAVVAVGFIVLARQLGQIDWSLYWPVLILENLVINSFFFMASLVLLEKGEGTIEAQVVTPLRPGEYLLSKAISLGLLSLFESLLMVVAVTGVGFNWPLLVAAIGLLVTFYGLYGFVAVSNYDSIGDFILPSVVWVCWFSLPLLYYFGLWQHWVMFLHPLQPMLVLMQAAFGKIPTWQLGYGLLYAGLWVWIAYWFSKRAFRRFVLRKQGIRR